MGICREGHQGLNIKGCSAKKEEEEEEEEVRNSVAEK
jgi:hypothetical protein